MGTDCSVSPSSVIQDTSNVFSESSFLTLFLRGFVPFSSLALKNAKALG